MKIAASSEDTGRWDTIYSCVVCAVSFIWLIVWVAFCIIWVFISGISVGDGAMSTQPSPDSLVILFPLLYLIVVGVSALPFVPRLPFVIATIVGQMVLIAALYSIVHETLDPIMIRIALIAFLAIDVLWLGLYFVKLKRT